MLAREEETLLLLRSRLPCPRAAAAAAAAAASVFKCRQSLVRLIALTLSTRDLLWYARVVRGQSLIASRQNASVKVMGSAVDQPTQRPTADPAAFPRVRGVFYN